MNYKTLVGCVNTNQKQLRFYLITNSFILNCSCNFTLHVSFMRLKFLNKKYVLMFDALPCLAMFLLTQHHNCLQVQFFCAESVRQPHSTIFKRSNGALSLIISMDIIHPFVIFYPQSKTSKLLSTFHSYIW